jgi:hypothetical protein
MVAKPLSNPAKPDRFAGVLTNWKVLKVVATSLTKLQLALALDIA